MARREEGAYSPYVTDEQRRQWGWIGAENDHVIHSRALGASLLSRIAGWGNARIGGLHQPLRYGGFHLINIILYQ
jgi:hypothetical protein